MQTDPIADLLTRIRNGLRIERPFVDAPHSKAKEGILAALQREGYIWEYEVHGEAPRQVLRIILKYGNNGERVLQEIHRVSRPGRRVYMGVRELPEVLQGLGITIVSTSQGIMSDREAREKKVGGEVLCKIW